MKSFGESTADITTVNSVNNPQLKQQWWLLTCKTLEIYNFTAKSEKFPLKIYLADYVVLSSLDHGFLMAQSVLIPLPNPHPPKQYIDFFFSSMCKVITVVGSNFLEGCKKILWRDVTEQKPHISIFWKHKY